MASLLDLAKERDNHIAQRLHSDLIIWLVSVRADGRPHAVAVWFLWDGETFLIFSRPNNQKIRNIQQNAYVVLALDDTQKGADPITVEGTATLLSPETVDAALPAYVAKYGEEIKGIGTTPEQMAGDYSQPIRIVPSRFS